MEIKSSFEVRGSSACRSRTLPKQSHQLQATQAEWGGQEGQTGWKRPAQVQARMDFVGWPTPRSLRSSGSVVHSQQHVARAERHSSGKLDSGSPAKTRLCSFARHTHGGNSSGASNEEARSRPLATDFAYQVARLNRSLASSGRLLNSELQVCPDAPPHRCHGAVRPCSGAIGLTTARAKEAGCSCRTEILDGQTKAVAPSPAVCGQRCPFRKLTRASGSSRDSTTISPQSSRLNEASKYDPHSGQITFVTWAANVS